MASLCVPDFQKLEKGIEMYDAHLQTNVLVVTPILLMLADNPQPSELLNHLGGRANKYCRMCMVSFVCAFFICAFYTKEHINTFDLGLALKLAQRFSLYSNIISRLCENHHYKAAILIHRLIVTRYPQKLQL